MGTIKDHVRVLRNDQTLLPGNEATYAIPAHGDTHELGGSDQIDGAMGLQYIEFDLTPPTLSASEGRLIWDSTEKTLSLDLAGGVSLPLGKETLLYAKNTAASPMVQGEVVYVNSGTGVDPTIAPADADTLATGQTVGVAAEAITNGDYGWVTTFGLIGGLNTTGLTAGTVLYLSSTAGAFTATRPAYPAKAVVVGQSVYEHASDGVILVTPTAIPDLGDLRLEALGVYGFENLTDTSIGFSEVTYTFTLTDTGSGWSYWRNGVRHTISGNKTVTLAGSPPTAGIYYIYIDDTSGTLTASTSTWTIADTKVLVAILEWNDSNTPKYFLAEERHQSIFPRRSHWHHHFTEGTEIKSGGLLSGYTVAPGAPADTDNTFAITQTEVVDEDLLTVSAALPDPNGTDLDYIVYFRTGASTWSWEQSEVPFRYTPAGYIQYDNAGTMTQGAQVKYFNWYLCFTNYADQPRYLLIPGQQEFSSAITAYQEEIQDLDLSGFSPQELVFGYQLTFYTSAAYSNKGKCRLTREPQAINVARVSSSISGGSVDHNTTAGLQGGNGVDEFYHLTAANHGYINQDVKTTGSPLFFNTFLDNDLTLNSGGSILTTSNGDINLVPNGTGITKVGTGTPGSIGSVAGSAYIQGRLEVDGNIYAHGGASVSSSFVSYTSLSFSGGNAITTTSNGDLSLIPNGTGITKVGSGSPGHLTPTSGELYVQGKCEIDGLFYADAGIRTTSAIYGSGTDFTVGSESYTTNGFIRWQSSAQTPDSNLIATGSLSNAYILCEYGDRNYDFAHALQTNPTLYIQSANQSATEWLSLAHNQTVGLISAGTGIEIATGANGDFTVDTASTERFKITGTTGIHHFPTTSSVQAYRNTTQSISDATWETVIFATETEDTQGEYDHTTGVFTADEAGKYHVCWMVHSSSAAWAVGEIWQSSVTKNATQTAGNQYIGNRWVAQAAHTDVAWSGGSVTVECAASDTLEIEVYHNQGGAVNTSAAGGRYVYLSIQKEA